MQPPQPSSQPMDPASYINRQVMKWSQDSKENNTDRKIDRIKKFFMPSSSGKKKPEEFFNVQPGGLISATKAQHQKEAEKNDRKSISKRRLLDDVTNVKLAEINNNNNKPVLQPIISAEVNVSSPQRLPLAQLNTIPSVADDNQRDKDVVELIEEDQIHQDGDFVPDTQPQQAPVDNRNDSITEPQPTLFRMEEQPMPIMQSSPIVVGRNIGQDIKLKRKSRVEQIRGEYRPRANEQQANKSIAPPSPMQNEFNQSLRRRSASSKRTDGMIDEHFDQFADIDDVVLGSNEIFGQQPNSTPNEIVNVVQKQLDVVNRSKSQSPPLTKNLQIQVIPIDLSNKSNEISSKSNQTPTELPSASISVQPQSKISITKGGKKGAAAAAQIEIQTPLLLPSSQRQPSPHIMPPPALPKSATTSVNTTARSTRGRLADVTNTIETEDNQDDNSMLQTQKDMFLRAKRSSNNSTVNKTAANQTTNKASALFTPALPRPSLAPPTTSSTVTTKATKRGLTTRTNLVMPTEPEQDIQTTPAVAATAAVPDTEVINLEDEAPAPVESKKRGRPTKGNFYNSVLISESKYSVIKASAATKEAPKTKQPSAKQAAKKDNATVPKKSTRVREEVVEEHENNHEEIIGGERISLRQRHNKPGARLVYGWDWETTADGQKIYVKKVVGCERRNDYVDELARMKATKDTAKKRQRTKSPKKKAAPTATVPNVAKKTKKKVIAEDDDDEEVEVVEAPQKKKARTTKAARNDQKTPQINDDHVMEDQVVEVHVEMNEAPEAPESEDESIGVNIINKPDDVPVIRTSSRLKEKRRELNLDAFNMENANEKNPALKKIEQVLLESEEGDRVPTRLFQYADENGTRDYKLCYDNVYIWYPSTRRNEGSLRVDAESQTRTLTHKVNATYLVQSTHPVIVTIEGVNAMLKAGDVFQVPQGKPLF